MRVTNRSRYDKRHPREDFVEFVIFHEEDTDVIIHPLPSLLAFAPFATGYVSAALATVI